RIPMPPEALSMRRATGFPGPWIGGSSCDPGRGEINGQTTERIFMRRPRYATGVLFFLILVLRLARAAPAASPAPRLDQTARNVILVIGDGMGPAQVHLLNLYRSKVEKKASEFKRAIQKGHLGLVEIQAYEVLGTDSAAAGTALASGHLTWPDLIGKG